MSAPSAIPTPSSAAAVDELEPLRATLGDLAEDPSLPRNVRKEAQAALADLDRPGVPHDVRIESAVYRLDELANDPNLPVHGRTALWSVISRLERRP